MIMPIEAHHGILVRDPSLSGVCLVMLYPGYETMQGAFSRRVLPLMILLKSGAVR